MRNLSEPLSLSGTPTPTTPTPHPQRVLFTSVLFVFFVVFYVLFTETSAWYEHVDGSPWTDADDQRLGLGDTGGGLLYNDDVYAVVFDNDTDARTYADQNGGVTETVDGNDRSVFVDRYDPNRLVVCDTVDDVYDACSCCCDEPTWKTTVTPL